MIYGRVMVDPVQNLGDSFYCSIEKVFLCTGDDGYVPKYSPENSEYGCLADSPSLLHRFKIVVSALTRRSVSSVKDEASQLSLYFEAISSFYLNYIVTFRGDLFLPNVTGERSVLANLALATEIIIFLLASRIRLSPRLRLPVLETSCLMPNWQWMTLKPSS